PVFVAGVVALFLLMMVGLGLTGVLWQNVTRRTRELGLRRAQGATASEIRWLILLEVTVSALLAIAVGGVLAAQLPLFGLELLAVLDSGLFFRSFLLSSFLLVALTTLCGLYPSWLATRIHPAEALAHE
ncbi:MAG: FtsX-like permease family protein, partial [Holophagales bacterium]|nr:FtsX-like permease family protein [Holophagales bacterium]